MELADRIQRGGSLYESDPQELLFKAFHKRSHDRFVAILSGGQIDVNHYYEEPESGTLLDFCANQDDSSEFLKTLLRHGANPNTIHRSKKKAPIHFIVERNNIKNLSILLELREKLDINIVDSFGNTALHYVAKGCKNGISDSKVLKMLLNFPGVNVNAQNRKEQTPAYLAALHGNKDSLLLLIHCEDVDLDTSKDFKGKSARDLITEKYGDNILLPLEPLIPLPQTVTQDYVFSLLRANNIDLFKRALNDNVHLIDSHDGFFTLLQYSCDHGFFEVVDHLIKLGADVNKTYQSGQNSPLMLASYKGFNRIVQRLIKSDVDILYSNCNKETVLHSVINGSKGFSELGDSEENKCHLKCLNLLLDHISNRELINQGDLKGNTALHYAGIMGNEELVYRLLEGGAYIGCINKLQDPAIAYITPAVFERYLDECIKTNKKLPREEGYEIIFKYKCFVPPWHGRNDLLDNSSQQNQQKLSNNLNETDLLLYASQSPDLRYLLMHPVIQSFIYMKWYIIRKWFFVNLIFYLIFWALLSIYILGVYDSVKSNSQLLKSNQTELDENSPSQSQDKNLIWYLVTLLLLLFIVRELFQLKKSYMQYIKNAENWLEVGLIGLTIVILFVNVEDGTKHQLAASAILLSWTGLVLLIGKHPSLSTHIEMLKTVAWNFLKILAWYSILIVAFALSFYTLFRNGQSDENKVFIDPGISVFKTIVMLTGEFEAGEIPFDEYPITSHLLFVLFVFAIAIVLYNLLNGLAVSDTQAIKSDAEMVGYVSRIKLVSYVETIDLLPCKEFIYKFKKCDFTDQNKRKGWFSCNQTVFSYMVDYEIHIFPNDRNKIDCSSTPKLRNELDDPVTCCLTQPCNCKDTIMDSSIVKSAQILLSKKQEQPDNVEICRSNINDNIIKLNKTLQDYTKVLREMEKCEQRIKNMIDSFQLAGDQARVQKFQSIT